MWLRQPSRRGQPEAWPKGAKGITEGMGPRTKSWKCDNQLNCTEAARGWRTWLRTDFDIQARLMPVLRAGCRGGGGGCRELGKQRQDHTGPVSSITRSLREVLQRASHRLVRTASWHLLIYQSRQVFYSGFSFLSCKHFLVYDRNVSVLKT